MASASALVPIEDLNLDILLALAERRAVAETDGHLTLLRFTTGWKFLLGIPNLDSGKGREEISVLKSYPTSKEALVAFLLQKGKG